MTPKSTDLQTLKRCFGSPSKRVVITMHQKPDADALGTALAWAHWLNKQPQAHQVTVVSPTIYPATLDWMPGIAQVVVFNPQNAELVEKALKRADVILCVDFGELSRLLALGHIVTRAAATKICIDHHTVRPAFADTTFWDPQAPAAAVLSYEIMQALDPTRIDLNVATCLYAGTVMDTGSFQHAHTNARAHQAAAAFLSYGVDVGQVSQKLFRCHTLRKLRFWGFALGRRLVLLRDLHTAYIAISQTDVQRFALQAGDTDGLVNEVLSLQDLQLAALIIEQQDGVHLSLRSAGHVPVNLLAKQHFSGGGHTNAAGGTSALGLDATIVQFKRIARQYQADPSQYSSKT